MQLVRPGRDLRVDFFRGLALWWIFVDHIPDNWVAQFSLRNFAFCDSTEVFVLLAGYAGGLVYGRAMDRRGWLFGAADVLKRAWTLYIAHIFLFVVFSAQVSYSATALDRADYLEEIGIDVMADAPYRAMLEALTLHYQPAYLNILPMYIALLTLFAFVLPLLRWPVVLGTLSFGLYAVARLTGLNLPSWTGNGWYFNPFAWQLLFLLGAILAYKPGTRPRGTVVLDTACGVFVGVSALLIQVVFPHPELAALIPGRIARVMLSVDKEALHPLRLVSILSLTWLVSRVVPPTARWLQTRLAHIFVLMGQHSLAVFCSGIFLSFLGRLVMEDQGGPVVEGLVNLVGFAALWAVAALSAFYRVKDQVSRPVTETKLIERPERVEA